MRLVFFALVLLLLMPAHGHQAAADFYNKGVELYENGQYDAAIKAFDEAIKLDPKMFVAWYNKGLALEAIGEFNESIKAYDEAIKLDPKDAIAWACKGSPWSTW